MSLAVRALTYEDLRRTPDDGNRYELIAGELIVSPAPTLNHGRIEQRLSLLLGQHVETNGLGEVFTAPVDVRFSRHNTVQPDLLFIRKDRIDQLDRGAVIEGAPDLVVEIISPRSRGGDRIRKAALYADFGVPEYWLVDPMERTVDVLRLVEGEYRPVEADAEGRLGSIVLAGLMIDPSDLFAKLRPQD